MNISDNIVKNITKTSKIRKKYNILGFEKWIKILRKGKRK